MALATSLNLDEAMAHALLYNHNLQFASADVDLADFNLKVQKSQFHPASSLAFYGDIEKNHHGWQSHEQKQLGLSPRVTFHSLLGTELHLQWNQQVLSGNASPMYKNTHWQVHVEQPLLQGASYYVNQGPIKEAQLQQKLSQYQWKETQARVLLNVIQSYALLYNSWQTFDLLQARLSHQRAFSQIVEEKIHLGRMSEVDGMAFKIQLASLEQRVNQSQMQLIQQSSQLARLIGKALESPQRLEPISVKVLALEMENFEEKALSNRLEPLVWQGDHLKDQEGAIRDRYLWDLRIKGVMSSGWQSYREDEIFPYDHGPSFYTQKHHYVGLFLTIPITKNPSLDFSLYQNKTSQYKQQLDYQQTKLETQQMIYQLKQQVHHWQRQHKISEQSYALAQKALDIEQKKYLAGYSSFYDWQTAQEMELQAAMDDKGTEVGLFLAQAELLYQAGILPHTWQDYVKKT